MGREGGGLTHHSFEGGSGKTGLEEGCVKGGGERDRVAEGSQQGGVSRLAWARAWRAGSDDRGDGVRVACCAEARAGCLRPRYLSAAAWSRTKMIVELLST